MGSPGTAAGSQHADKRSLRSLQSLLVRCLAELIRYAYSRGYELTLGEAYVQTPRSGEVLITTTCPKCSEPHEFRHKGFIMDRVHMPSSLHYTRLAIDLNLFIDGAFITHSDHVAWRDLGAYWEQLDPACSSGIRFHDANHFSVTFGGKR